MVEFRDIRDQIFDNTEREAQTLLRYRTIVIEVQSTIDIQTNSLNEVQAISEGGDFGISTKQFTKKSNVLTKASLPWGIAHVNLSNSGKKPV